MSRQTPGQAACSLALLLCLTLPAYAGSFSVSPVRVTLSAGQPVAAMTVHNSEAEPTVVQLELVQWSQQDGQDIYTPTKDLLATPPIFTLPANGSQIIRVGLRKPLAGTQEAAYRIFLHEIPGPPKPGFQGLQVALKIGVPIFVPPAAAAAPKLRWSARAGDGRQLIISARNDGNTHVQIANISLSRPDGGGVAVQQLGNYVLPGQQRQWRLTPDVMPTGPLRLFARTDAGDMQAEIPIEKD